MSLSSVMISSSTMLDQTGKEPFGEGFVAFYAMANPFPLNKSLAGDRVCMLNFFKCETPPSLVLGGIQTHNLQILGQTPKPSCLGAVHCRILYNDQSFPDE